MFLKLKKYFQNHKVEILLLILIILFAAFFRLYKISDYMTFLGDEGRDAIVAKDILRGDLTLLGPRASAGDFFLGPIYYYMMAPFLLLTDYDPVGPAIMVALIGIATVYLVYHVGKRMFGMTAGFIAAALYAIAPVVVAYSRSSWNPNPMPFFSLLMLYLLFVAIRNNKLPLYVVVGFLLGIAMQLHYLSTFLAVIVFFFVLIGRLMVSKKNIIKNYLITYSLILAGFLAGFSPFLLFEVRHGFPNLRTIFSFILGGSGGENMSPNYSFAGNLWDVFYRLFARLVTKYPPPEQVNVTENFHLQVWMGATIILAILSIVALFKTKERLKVALFGLWLFLGIVLFGFYKKNIYDYYLGFMFPLPFLLVGNFFSKLTTWRAKSKTGVIIAFISLLVLFLLNISGNPFLYPANKQKDQAKTIAEFVLSKTNGEPFNFALLTRGNSDHVYRYFFEIAGMSPVTILNPDIDPDRKSVTDQLLIVCEYQECQPLGNPLWEVAGFGRATIAGEWNISFVKVYRLVHYERPEGYRLENLDVNAQYDNRQLNMSFLYPESFLLSDETGKPYHKDPKPFLRLRLETPDVPAEDRQKEGFDRMEYGDNTMRINITVQENKNGLALQDFIQNDISGPGIDGRTPAVQSLREGLVSTNTPKDGSYVYEGLGGGENQRKIYYFNNQNYVYYFEMMGGVDTGDRYTPEAEGLFDEIVASIEFK